MNAADRAKLDEIISTLCGLGGGLNIDDFRENQMISAKKTALFIRIFIILFGFMFMALAFSLIYLASPLNNTSEFRSFYLYSGLWAVALGGLGAVTNIFLDIFKLVPQQTLRSSDLYEVFVRVMLGVLFSFVLNITLLSGDTVAFFEQISKSKTETKPSINLLAPFIMGYSLSLVLGILDKAVTAIEITIGLDDRRASAVRSRASRQKTR